MYMYFGMRWWLQLYSLVSYKFLKDEISPHLNEISFRGSEITFRQNDISFPRNEISF